MVKATMSGLKQKVLEEKQKRQEKRVRRVKSPKRKVIRVESEETQDHVREAMDLSQEEAEEISFVPSEVIVPPKPSVQ